MSYVPITMVVYIIFSINFVTISVTSFRYSRLFYIYQEYSPRIWKLHQVESMT